MFTDAMAHTCCNKVAKGKGRAHFQTTSFGMYYLLVAPLGLDFNHPNRVLVFVQGLMDAHLCAIYPFQGYRILTHRRRCIENIIIYIIIYIYTYYNMPLTLSQLFVLLSSSPIGQQMGPKQFHLAQKQFHTPPPRIRDRSGTEIDPDPVSFRSLSSRRDDHHSPRGPQVFFLERLLVPPNRFRPPEPVDRPGRRVERLERAVDSVRERACASEPVGELVVWVEYGTCYV